MNEGVPAALELSGIGRSFGATRALDAASLRVRAGTVHALLGENGAGKTTLMRIAFGLLHPDDGTMTLNGAPYAPHSAADAIALGLGMVHQHFTLVPAMTVGENLVLGGRGLLQRWPAEEEGGPIAASLAGMPGAQLDLRARVETLSVSAQQRVEIAKALVRHASLLILDEPTAVLAPAESDELLRWLRSYADAGHAVVLITHKLREALAVADDVTVLRRGVVAWSGAAADTDAAALTRAMIGEGAIDREPPAAPVLASGGALAFEVVGVSARDERGTTRLRDASFHVRGGELVGIVGVEGSGQRELLRVLAGRIAPAAGEVRRPAIVGFVPEDRHEDAVLLERSLTENVALRGAGERRGRISWSALRSHTARLLAAFDVRAPGEGTIMRALSGGNQQKLVLARELGLSRDGEEPLAKDASVGASRPEGVVLENPTRGLDVRATAEIHEQLRDACRKGAAVVLYSSDIDEVLALASRVLVTHAGVVREVAPERDAVGRAMLGTA